MLYITFLLRRNIIECCYCCCWWWFTRKQTRKQARKKERKKRSRTCLDSVSLFAMHGMTQPNLLLRRRRRLRLRDGGGGEVASRSRNQAHKANSLVVYIYFAPNLFIFAAAAATAARIYGNPSGDYQIFELFCVGGIVATKRGFRQCAPRDFPLRCTLTTHRAALPAGIRRHICTILFASFC